MRVKKERTTYRTDDGRTFVDKAKAEEHEALDALRRAYEEAKYAFGKAMAERFQTADGEPFKIGLWHDYYFITPGYFSLPVLVKVDFWGRNWDWREGSDESDSLVLVDCKDDRGQTMDHHRDFRIDELYWHEQKAKAALKKRQLEWLEEKKKEIAG
jgi:hypothetical protein